MNSEKIKIVVLLLFIVAGCKTSFDNPKYSAGEADTGAISGEKVVAQVGHYHPNVRFEPTLDAVSQFLTHNLQPGDICMFLGAGNLNQIIPDVVEFYRTATSPSRSGSVA